MSQTWQGIASSKRESLNSSIPPEWVIPSAFRPPAEQKDVSKFIAQSEWFTESEVEILSTPASTLQLRLAQGLISSEEVTLAFCKSASAAQQLINPVTEILFDEALATAKDLDEYLKVNGKPKGPLHGLPISLKDNFNIKGKDSSLGFTSMVGKPAATNGPIAQLLLDAGAVLYVKTNVPPGMKRAETYNEVFGKTVNPMNSLWAVGGSSGGEGALISFGGSCLGVGSDLGGSCRIPAACGGLFTLRPSVGRWSISKNTVCTPGQDSIPAVPGPMAKTLDDVIMFSKAFADQAPWKYDPQCVPLKWQEVEPKSHLKLAVMWNDGLVAPTPPVQRALEGTVKTLKEAGHEIIDWKVSAEDMQDMADMSFSIFLADSGNWLKKVLEPTGEPVPPGMLWPITGSPKTLIELQEFHVWRDNVRMKWLQKWNSFEGLDGVLIPTSPYGIPEHGKFKYANYTMLWNSIDYPASSFPSGYYVDKDLDKPYTDYTPLGNFDKTVHEEYNPAVCHGAPVSLQIVGRRLEEEKVLMMTKVVHEALSKA
ncbi:acetamidase [Penicillium herquei]|nr:acetamidase [Penicillium herquei]